MASTNEIADKCDALVRDLESAFNPPEAILCVQMLLARLWFDAAGDADAIEASIKSLRRLHAAIVLKEGP